MDPVGATASLITLLGVALQATKLINRAIGHYRDAPNELVRLKHKVDGVKSQLVLLHYLQEAIECDIFKLENAEVTRLVDRFIKDTLPLFSAICQYFETQSHTDRDGKKGRLRWALHDAANIKQWDMSFQRHSADLGSILLLLNLRLSGLVYTEVAGFKHHITALQAMIRTQRQPIQNNLPQRRNYKATQMIIPYIARAESSLSHHQSGKNHAYAISFRIHALFCLKVLCINFTLAGSMFPIGSLLNGVRMNIRPVIPEDSELITACLRGDTQKVWSLFQAGKASVHDITPANRSPLRYAIESGSTELVSFLINSGADVNECCGPIQTNLVQSAFGRRRVECIRLLLSKGGEVNANAYGWTPAFSVFNTSQDAHLKPCIEYLEILSAASFTDFNIQDNEGWTCIHRAAAYGHAEDIKLLLKLRADPKLQTIKVSWMPIFCAVQFGNISTFNELRKVHDDFLALRDIRNWTLLHLAVNAKRLEMMELLINLGADPHARTLATEFLVPDDLKAQSFTPGDIANLRGEDILSRYVGALRRCGYDLEIAKDIINNDLDIFWPSVEEV